MRQFSAILAVLVLGAVLSGCTAEQRSDCVVCNVTGLCRLLGDDPNAAMRKHPAWFGLPWSPAPTGLREDDANASLRPPDANGCTIPPAYRQPISGPDSPAGVGQPPTFLATAGRVTAPAQIGA